jgi:hypothetical protein
MSGRIVAKCFWEAKADAIARRVVSECSMAGTSAGFNGVNLIVEIREGSIGMEAAEGVISAAIVLAWACKASENERGGPGWVAVLPDALEVSSERWRGAVRADRRVEESPMVVVCSVAGGGSWASWPTSANVENGLDIMERDVVCGGKDAFKGRGVGESEMRGGMVEVQLWGGSWIDLGLGRRDWRGREARD